jgi:N6-adenosine-specific RNA methylase IME4
VSAADGATPRRAATRRLSGPPATVAPVTAAPAADLTAPLPGPPLDTTPPDAGRAVEGPRRARAEPLRVDVAPLEAPPLPRTGGGWSCVYADPPWRFSNRTGKVAPEHRRLDRYDTMTAPEIAALPVADVVADNAHLYLWVPNALLPEGLAVMQGWGFRYVSNLVWAKRRKDGGPDGRGVGFYFRNVTELILFGVRGSMRTLDPARRQVNMIETVKREHSRKPDEAYQLIEACSPGPYLEMFARYPREGWTVWGAEADEDVAPRGRQYPSYRGTPVAGDGHG